MSHRQFWRLSRSCSGEGRSAKHILVHERAILASGAQQKSSACTMVASAAGEPGRCLCRTTFSGGTCISGQTVLAAAQQESIWQCLVPALAAYCAAAAASTAPAEGPAMPQGGQSLPDMRRQVDALVAQDGEQCTSQL